MDLNPTIGKVQGMRFTPLLKSIALSLILTGGAFFPAPKVNAAPAAMSYQTPPAPLDKLLEAPFFPGVSTSPDKQYLLLLHHQTLPSLEDLSQPELRLAGVRLNPQNHAPSRNWYYADLSLVSVKNGQKQPVKGLPKHARLANIQWSPDGKHVAFTHTSAQGVTLWVVNILSGQARQIPGVIINKTYGYPYEWLDNQHLVAKQLVPGEAPQRDIAPPGPVILENKGVKAPARTYQDLLKSPQDEALFTHHMRSQVIKVSLSGQRIPLGQPDLIKFVEPSPNGQYLLVHRLTKPFSYSLPAYRFPQLIEVWDTQGKRVQTVATVPLADRVPIGYDAVRTGRRHVEWRSDKGATLFWVEAQDGGDPKAVTKVRDALYTWEAPFQKNPHFLLEMEYRFRRIYWGDGDTAIFYEGWHKNRLARAWRIQPDASDFNPQKLFEYKTEDRYNLPGSPVLERTAMGTYVLKRERNQIFLKGLGASPRGNEPFLDRFSLKTLKNERIWQSKAPFYEQVSHVFDRHTLLLRRETPTMPPNYYLKDLKTQQLRALTHFPHPLPELAQIQKRRVEFARKDGVKLSGDLYLPQGYKPSDGPLPTLIWAYPREYKSASAASQVKGSPYEFIRVSLWSPLVFLTQGYAVLDRPAMPIIGEGQQEPNDTYVSQLVSNAQTLIDGLVALGVSDRERFAVGGHSYGAFMTANLLAHSDLFKAGIARSGAYNRTLTPFGFQSEERTLWQAPEVYFKMSPLMHAHQIKEPLLLIHGEADNNSGTYPMQSRYLYSALKGLGGHARLVMLPHESHGYRAKESLGHTLWEMVTWLDEYVK